MQYTKGYKFRLYPNKTQKTLLNKILGSCRFVYNHFLNVRRETYETYKKSVSYAQTSSMLTQLKKEITWLNESDSIALQQSLRNLDTAYQNFFKHDRGYPKFKSKKNHRQTYKTMGVRIEGKRIRLPKVGQVKFEQSREFQGKILSATITRTATEKYFVSLCIEEDIADSLKLNAGKQIGIDVGLKEFYTDNFGNSISNPRILKSLTVKLCREQRRLSKKKIGSNNRNKQRIKVAKVHERIVNTRLDFLHKESTRLCRENQTIAVESLQVKNLMKNHKLAKAISDVSWGEFFRQLNYKAILYGCDLIKVPTFYPSSQTCSNCGFQNPITKNLNVRSWFCPKCGTFHDRDINAAVNILQKALEIKNSD
jgi:putative transposase